MLRVGLTGGIGSGKSTVAKIFEVLQVPVYYADNTARNLVNTDPTVREAIIKAFGAESYNGTILNRPYIASLVFTDEVKLQKLNSITHPATIQHAEEWMQQQKGSYSIKEAALLFESKSADLLDVMIGVTAPLELRIERTMARDHITREEVLQRISRQMNEEEKMKLCDYVVVNDELQLLIPQVLTLHEKLLNKAGHREKKK